MAELDNWKTQIRKGYLELCLLMLIKTHKRIYGFELLEKMADLDLQLKEGTLYPLLNRLTADSLLQSAWETENLKGHPRKFYSLTRDGQRALTEMQIEYDRMLKIYQKIIKE